MEVWRMDIGSGFGGDDRQRYLRIALVAGVVLVVLLLILIVVAIVRGRSGGADATQTPRPSAGRSASPIVAPSTSPTPRATLPVTLPSSSAAASAPASSAPSAAASAPASASTSGKAYVVANTNGDGVFLRSEPSGNADKVVDLALPDGTRLIEIGPGRNADGHDWVHVRVDGGDNDGKEGWVAAEFTAAAP
jgi:hypothetical protein